MRYHWPPLDVRWSHVVSPVVVLVVVVVVVVVVAVAMVVVVVVVCLCVCVYLKCTKRASYVGKNERNCCRK